MQNHLQNCSVGRSRVLFPMKSLIFFFNLVNPFSRTKSWSLLSLRQKLVLETEN
jgi:hypothetical protein